MNIYSFQKRLSLRLLVWSVISLSVGAAIRVVSGTRDVFTGGGVSAPGDLWRGVALEAVIWGAISAIIAIAGFVGSIRGIRARPDEVQEVRRTIRLRRILEINARLDLLYIIVGVALAIVYRTDRFLLGNGIGIVTQGVVLFLIDRLHALHLPSDTPAWYDPGL